MFHTVKADVKWSSLLTPFSNILLTPDTFTNVCASIKVLNPNEVLLKGVDKDSIY